MQADVAAWLNTACTRSWAAACRAPGSKANSCCAPRQQQEGMTHREQAGRALELQEELWRGRQVDAGRRDCLAEEGVHAHICAQVVFSCQHRPRLTTMGRQADMRTSEQRSGQVAAGRGDCLAEAGLHAHICAQALSFSS